ncbi:ferredoxin reductase [soil metagenome]
MSAPSGGWCTGVVREVRHPTPDAVLLRIEVAGRTNHLPGQHYVFRLTAEDGYTASRSYSVASAPGDPLLEFLVERLDDGEVSAHLADVVEVGDELELRGPIGGWFVWDGERRAVGVAGGTGVVPLVSMLRHARDLGRPELVRVLVSARNRETLPYAVEVADQVVVLTRERQEGRPLVRVRADDLAPLTRAAGDADVFVCGSAGFAEAASTVLVGLGVPASAVRVERFGPTG